MPETDLSLLIRAAEQAGDIACRYSGPEAQKWEKPGGAGPVTEADLAVNEMLSEVLLKARPDYGWLSEESEDTETRLDHDRLFIIDPIDGTRSFAEGSRTWAHSLAIAEDGEITAAVIYLPQRDLMYCAARGQGATCNGAEIRVSTQADLNMANVLAARPVQDPKHWQNSQVPGFNRSHRPSLAYRMARVADAGYDAMLTLRPSWEWDIAAGDLILREAGGCCSDRFGGELRYNNPHPTLNGVIAAPPRLHDQLIIALDPQSPGLRPL
ncbi:3'(2'),5'-bisphosphate nucleotidase CysQ [Phaeobacter inhibens]|uniref:inositol monophosphatase family protein n=1 Tax=Phaeobacter inhibens TaxID=221822 RepID=UPI0027531161|nr:3'(2'),5'-bisphosphate nucleotidase CysQ [Phaeobacter inhibens]GLO72024.1 3'(2'),5'-bisphosphate nucleotidase CysQ [Phaeobacter inhibens]